MSDLSLITKVEEWSWEMLEPSVHDNDNRFIRKILKAADKFANVFRTKTRTKHMAWLWFDLQPLCLIFSWFAVALTKVSINNYLNKFLHHGHIHILNFLLAEIPSNS